MNICIVGAGISGLATAYYLNQISPEKNITIIESEKVGGHIQTEEYEDCVLESGPHDIYIKSPLLKQMCEKVGVELTSAQKEIEKRFILKEAQLFKAPPDFEKMSKTSLVFLTEKMKISKAFKKKYSFWPAMSVYEAFKSVFGLTSADYFSSPLMRYWFHADAEDIEIASAFPEVYEALSESPNIREAVQKTKRDELLFWQEELKDCAPDLLEPGFFTVDQGLARLPQGLKTYLKNQGVRFEFARIQKLHVQNLRVAEAQVKKYVLQSKNQKFRDYDLVIFTAPIPELARIFRDFDKGLSQLLGEVKESRTSSVYHGWSPQSFSMSGHGVFCPRVAKMPFLFTLFLSNLYPAKSPTQTFLTRTYLSGDHDVFDDADLEKMSLDSLKRLLKIKGEPLWNRVYRGGWSPKYRPGHSEWKEKVLSNVASHPGLHFHGMAFHGLQTDQLLEASYRLASGLSKSAS